MSLLFTIEEIMKILVGIQCQFIDFKITRYWLCVSLIDCDLYMDSVSSASMVILVAIPLLSGL